MLNNIEEVAHRDASTGQFQNDFPLRSAASYANLTASSTERLTGRSVQFSHTTVNIQKQKRRDKALTFHTEKLNT